MKRSKKGFTLLELIAVIAVLAITASIGLPVFNKMEYNRNLVNDNNTAKRYTKAVQDFELIDYTSDMCMMRSSDGTLTSVKNNGLMWGTGTIYACENANMTQTNIQNLTNSGKGVMPSNKSELISSIKISLGCETSEIQFPKSDLSKVYALNKTTNAVELTDVTVVAAHLADYISLN